ncbi:MAG: BamA/TamA family outer membrane protein, partial [Bacteroidota bacterium]
AQIGYAFNDRPEYTRTTINAGFVYTWETTRGTRYSYNLWDLSLINTRDIAESFQTILDEQAAQGNNLRRTFEPSLVSSSQISATYNFLKNKTHEQQTAYLRVLVDAGGTVWNLLNPNTAFPESFNLATFKYLKFNTDFIRYRPLRDNSVLAYRFNIGMAGSYDNDNPELPFEKYFFAGGSNSIRAWSPRRLGPGSYRQQDSLGNIQLLFDQQGEILLASSVEWRRNIFDFIDGAIFVDVGNTWVFREETVRPGANFDFSRFWNEFAVGVGAGIRADFSFLILRLDVGVKAHDPAFPLGSRWFPSEYAYDQPFLVNNPAYTLNLGIGYPF